MKMHLVFLALALGGTASAHAEDSVATPATQVTNSHVWALSPAERAEAVKWACDLIQNNLPATYRGKKNWDHRKRIYAGVDVDFEDGKLRTHRKYREVRHGNWLRYQIDLKDPADVRNLQFTVIGVETLADNRMRVDLQIDSTVDIELQQQRWNLGVQLYSVTSHGHARVRLRLLTDIGSYFDTTKIPPDVILDPIVRKTDLQLVDLEMDKIGALGSDLAEELGDIVERELREDYLPKQREKLTEKLNQQIDRRRSKLRISVSDWLARYLKPSSTKP